VRAMRGGREQGPHARHERDREPQRRACGSNMVPISYRSARGSPASKPPRAAVRRCRTPARSARVGSGAKTPPTRSPTLPPAKERPDPSLQQVGRTGRGVNALREGNDPRRARWGMDLTRLSPRDRVRASVGTRIFARQRGGKTGELVTPHAPSRRTAARRSSTRRRRPRSADRCGSTRRPRPRASAR
jgi:hypothetical protein